MDVNQVQNGESLTRYLLRCIVQTPPTFSRHLDSLDGMLSILLADFRLSISTEDYQRIKSETVRLKSSFDVPHQIELLSAPMESIFRQKHTCHVLAELKYFTQPLFILTKEALPEILRLSSESYLAKSSLRRQDILDKITRDFHYLFPDLILSPHSLKHIQLLKSEFIIHPKSRLAKLLECRLTCHSLLSNTVNTKDSIKTINSILEVATPHRLLNARHMYTLNEQLNYYCAKETLLSPPHHTQQVNRRVKELDEKWR